MVDFLQGKLDAGFKELGEKLLLKWRHFPICGTIKEYWKLILNKPDVWGETLRSFKPLKDKSGLTSKDLYKYLTSHKEWKVLKETPLP